MNSNNNNDFNFSEISEKMLACLTNAENIALKYKTQYIEAAHVIYSMLDLNCIGSKIINDICKDIDGLRTEIENLIKTNILDNFDKNNVEFSDELRDLFIKTKEVAKKFNNDNIIVTEYFLFAVLSSNNSVSSILNKYGINLNNAKDRFFHYLSNVSKKQQTNDNGTKNISVKSQSYVDQYCIFMNKLALEGKYLPLIGREREINRIIQILCRKTKNNPAIIGDSGVGKTAIVEGLVQLAVSNSCHKFLRNKKFYMLDIGSIVAGSKYRGQFEERFKNIIKELSSDKDNIVVIDEFHMIVGAGAAEGALDASNLFKPLLARGDIKVIGITTQEEYRKYIEKDTALSRRFQPILINTPTFDETYNILLGIKDKFCEFHGVSITNDAIVDAIKLSDRYIIDKLLPDKAIDVIDEAMSMVKLSNIPKTVELLQLEEKIKKLNEEIQQYIIQEDFDKCKAIDQEILNLKGEIDKKNKEIAEEAKQKLLIVNSHHIAEVVSTITGIPLTKIANDDERKKLLEMEKEISKRIVSQKDAIMAVCRVVRRSRVGIKDPTKPQGCFLFLGPTGVGKTELARVLTEYLFGDDSYLLKIDMSEYMEKYSVSKLIGAPPGYIGYDGSGVFEKIRRRPYSVILFDEIEKAHPDVLDILLQICEDGQIMDSHKNIISFRNSIIILTSNIGVIKTTANNIGFIGNDKKEDYENLKNSLISEVKKTIKPELLNRFDDIIVFNYLTKEDCAKVIDIYNSQCNNNIFKNYGYELILSEKTKNKILQDGFNSDYGARPLKRVYQKVVLDNLANYMLNNNIDLKDSKILVDIDDNDSVIFSIQPTTEDNIGGQ